jgi:phosphatidylserine decarboxylase
MINKEQIDIIKHRLLPKRLLTIFFGILAKLELGFITEYLINDFIKKYKVDMRDALDPNVKSYPTFNDFFIRKLKPALRPLVKAKILSPVDGLVSEIGKACDGKILQVKKHYYTVKALFAGDKVLAEKFNNANFMTLYLAPNDYHRIHVPLDCVLKQVIYVPGKLFSVRPQTVRGIKNLFAINERVVCVFETKLGPMVMVLVGATIVGKIGLRCFGEFRRFAHKKHFSFTETFRQGDELGYFKLGSTVLLFFAEEVNFAQSLLNTKVVFGSSLC